MINWDAKVINNKSDILKHSKLFNKAFPKRSNSFFKEVLLSIDGKRSKLIVLKIDDIDVVGALLIYKVDGFGFECWAPSYFFVLDDYRNLSIPFLIKAQNLTCDKIINVTPSDSMCNILKALRYKNFTFGSSIMLNILDLFGLLYKSKKNLNLSSCIPKKKYKVDEAFFNRKDLTWISFEKGNTEILLCFKKSSWLGIPLQILVYSRGIKDIELFESLKRINKSCLGLSLIVYPKFYINKSKLNLVSKKFRVFGNFDKTENLYSVLGSEVTEIL